jgi:hypothetical protein
MPHRPGRHAAAIRLARASLLRRASPNDKHCRPSGVTQTARSEGITAASLQASRTSTPDGPELNDGDDILDTWRATRRGRFQ